MAAKSRKDTEGSPLTGDALHQSIAERAYELYCRRGRRDGDDLKDWYEAERDVLAGPKRPTRRTTSRSSVIGRTEGRQPILKSVRPA